MRLRDEDTIVIVYRRIICLSPCVLVCFLFLIEASDS